MTVLRFAHPRMSAQEAANRIMIPLDRWPGRCHHIAKACLDARVTTGRLAYGLYWGPIDPRSRFAGRPFTHHGWIELRNHRVFDPTRWVFEHAAPYLYVGPATDYDFGGNRLLEQKMTTPPGLEGRVIGHLKLRREQYRKLGKAMEFKRWLGPVTEQQAHWLGNLPLSFLGDDAADLYQELIRIGRPAYIPIDNRRRALEEETA